MEKLRARDRIQRPALRSELGHFGRHRFFLHDSALPSYLPTALATKRAMEMIPLSMLRPFALKLVLRARSCVTQFKLIC